MKYGESTFDILYLIIAIAAGILILRRSKTVPGRLSGLAVLILGCGDAFHLVPRVLNYFTAADMTAWLGIGKLVTSLTMTVFYVLMYHLWQKHYKTPEDRSLTVTVYVLAALRFVLCLFPGNGWLTGEGSVLWAILRNAPFVALGIIIVVLWFRTRKQTPAFGRIWLWVTLSFLFYIPVAVGAGRLPILGMLMLPKTICYILIIIVFYRYFRGKEADAA